MSRSLADRRWVGGRCGSRVAGQDWLELQNGHGIAMAFNATDAGETYVTSTKFTNLTPGKWSMVVFAPLPHANLARAAPSTAGAPQTHLHLLDSSSCTDALLPAALYMTDFRPCLNHCHSQHQHFHTLPNGIVSQHNSRPAVWRK